MGERKEGNEIPRAYEEIAPETRFISLAADYLEKHGEQTQNGNGRTAYWPKNRKSSDRYFYKLSSYVSGHMMMPIINYTLDHYLADKPKHMTRRYMISANSYGTSPIAIFNSDGSDIDPDDYRDGLRELLTIMAKIAPEDSEQLLNDIFDYRFESLVGSYILSDLAIERPTEEITDAIVEEQTDKHVARVDDLELKALQKARRTHDDAHPQPAYYEAVEEAVVSRRRPTKRNRFKPVDEQAVTQRFAASSLYRKWDHRVVKPTQQDEEDDAPTVRWTKEEIQAAIAEYEASTSDSEPEDPDSSSDPSSEV